MAEIDSIGGTGAVAVEFGIFLLVFGDVAVDHLRFVDGAEEQQVAVLDQHILDRMAFQTADGRADARTALDLDPADAGVAVGVAVGKEGSLQVIKDMGLKEPFVGTVPLQSGEIGDDFSYYFMASEQIPSVVSVGVLVNDTNEILSSGGFIIQLLPNATDEDIQFIEERMKDFPPVSALIHEGKTPEDILKVIFEDVEILATQDLFFECDCSKDKMATALMTVGKDEIQAMIDEDHGCEMKCQFCNEKYQFNEDDLNEILKEID